MSSRGSSHGCSLFNFFFQINDWQCKNKQTLQQILAEFHSIRLWDEKIQMIFQYIDWSMSESVKKKTYSCHLFRPIGIAPKICLPTTWGSFRLKLLRKTPNNLEDYWNIVPDCALMMPCQPNFFWHRQVYLSFLCQMTFEILVLVQQGL